MTLERELLRALELARECGRIALAYQTGGAAAMETRDKPGDEGPVTRADTEINARLVEALRAGFPGDAVIGEESDGDAAAAAGASRCWYIDPIDGTTEFALGDTCWAIQIGLCIDGEPALGVVFEAAARRLSWGLRGRGAWAEFDEGPATPLRPSTRGLADLRVVSSKSHASPRTDEVLAALAIPPARNLRTGSVGVKVGYIARGDAELYVHPRTGTKLWDTCAPAALLQAAGGVVTDLWGRPLRYDPRRLRHDAGLIASHGPHHAAIVATLRPRVAAWSVPQD